jgi:hypothetical protein
MRNFGAKGLEAEVENKRMIQQAVTEVEERMRKDSVAKRLMVNGPHRPNTACQHINH